MLPFKKNNNAFGNGEIVDELVDIPSRHLDCVRGVG